MDHIAHQPGLDGQAFHLVHPRRQPSVDVLNAFARAGHAPHMAMRIDKRLLDALPKGTISMVLKLPALRGVRDSVLADFGIPPEVIGHIGFTCQFDSRDTERALEGSGIAVPELDDYAWRLWDYWERNLDPDLYKDRSFEHAVNGKTVVITGASSGIGLAAAMKIAAAGGIPILVARSLDKLEATKAEIEEAGGTAYAYSADLSDLESIESLIEQMLSDHAAIDMLVNNAGRSIRRSIALSTDRFHDFERTIQLNYFGAIKLITMLLPHMRERGSGHIVNVSSIGVQTNPRGSAPTSRRRRRSTRSHAGVVGSRRRRRHVHHNSHAARPHADDRADEDLRLVPDDLAGRGRRHRLRGDPGEAQADQHAPGHFWRVAYALAPKAVDQILHMAYKVFPDSAAAKGEKDPSEKANMEQVAMANILKGVHW